MIAKKNLVLPAITSVVCLLPLCLSFAVYNDLPDRTVMQWNLEGNPNWYAHKAASAFGLPIFFMVFNIALYFLFCSDSKRKNISKAMQAFTCWLVPVVSIIITPLVLFMNLGVNLPMQMIILSLMGVLFIFTGNYLPKNRQNYTVGIRLPWTLNSAENWNKTHRMASVLFIIGGMLFIITAFLPLKNVVGILIILTIVIITVIVPALYSYSIHVKDKNKNR